METHDTVKSECYFSELKKGKETIISSFVHDNSMGNLGTIKCLAHICLRAKPL